MNVEPTTACAALDIWCRMDAHEGQAAWAQAIGTVLAVATAVFLPWWQVEQNRKDSVLERKQRLRVIGGVALAAHELVESLNQDFDGLPADDLDGRDTWDLHQIAPMVQAMSLVPLVELPSPEAVSAYLMLQSTLVKSEDLLVRGGAAKAGSKIRFLTHVTIARGAWRQFSDELVKAGVSIPNRWLDPKPS